MVHFSFFSIVLVVLVVVAFLFRLWGWMFFFRVWFIVDFRVVVLVSCLNLWCNMSAFDRIILNGLVIFWLVMLGVVLWIGSNRLGFLVELRFVVGSMLRLFVSIDVLLLRMLLNMFLVRIMLKWRGVAIRCIAVELMSWCSSLMCGNLFLCTWVMISCYR